VYDGPTTSSLAPSGRRMQYKVLAGEREYEKYVTEIPLIFPSTPQYYKHLPYFALFFVSVLQFLFSNSLDSFFLLA
jgi:hypothetical protein